MIQWILEKTKIVKSVVKWPICDRWVFGSTTIKINFERIECVKLILLKSLSRLNVNFFFKLNIKVGQKLFSPKIKLKFFEKFINPLKCNFLTGSDAFIIFQFRYCVSFLLKT
jgi:hypothetical protein